MAETVVNTFKVINVTHDQGGRTLPEKLIGQQARGLLAAKAEAAFLVVTEPLVKAGVLVTDFAQGIFPQVEVDVAEVLLV